jgi:hypothetical protein
MILQPRFTEELPTNIAFFIYGGMLWKTYLFDCEIILYKIFHLSKFLLAIYFRHLDYFVALIL